MMGEGGERGGESAGDKTASPFQQTNSITCGGTAEKGGWIRRGEEKRRPAIALPVRQMQRGVRGGVLKTTCHEISFLELQGKWKSLKRGEGIFLKKKKGSNRVKLPLSRKEIGIPEIKERAKGFVC